MKLQIIFTKPTDKRGNVVDYNNVTDYTVDEGVLVVVHEDNQESSYIYPLHTIERIKVTN